MFSVRFHGRGGQGVVTAAELLALAAFSEDRLPQLRLGARGMAYGRQAFLSGGAVREHGQPSWTALKQLIETRLSEPGHPALTHLRWVVSRFGGADGRDWTAPSDDELREHFTDDYVFLTSA